MRELSGKTAFITGGDSGIGFGAAEIFCEAGLKVIICGLTDESVTAAAERLSARGEVHGVVLDVRDREAYAAVADWIDGEHGGVDVLFNNAGVGFLTPALEATFEQWDWVMAINLTGVYNGIRTFVPRMIASGRPGHVVATASIAGLVGTPGTVYATAKFAVVGLMESLALELRDTPIGVSVLTPGLVRTNIAGGPPPPGGRIGIATASPPPDHGHVPKMEPREVGARVLQAIRADQLYVITHAEHRDLLTQRGEAILRSVPVEDVDPRRAERELTMLANPVYAAQNKPGRPVSPGVG